MTTQEPPAGQPSSDHDAIVAILVDLADILDQRQWNRLADVFAPDAVAYRGEQTGLVAIERGIRASLGGCGPSQHLLGNHRVVVDGDRAHSITKVRVLHIGKANRSQSTFECLGDYHDEFVRTPAGWRIMRRRFDVQIRLGDADVLQPG